MLDRVKKYFSGIAEVCILAVMTGIYTPLKTANTGITEVRRRRRLAGFVCGNTTWLSGNEVVLFCS